MIYAIQSGHHNPHVKYAPVGYTYNADIYCLDCTSKRCQSALDEYARLRHMIPAGYRAWRIDGTHETWFIRGKRVIAKRYNKRGRCVSKRVVVHDIRAVWVECCTECHLDLWARAKGLKDRTDEYSFDSAEFPKHIGYHDACQLSCSDVGCEYNGMHNTDCPDDCNGHCAVDCPDDCDGESHCNGEHHERCGDCGGNICEV